MDPATIDSVVNALLALAAAAVMAFVVPLIRKQGQVADGKLSEQARDTLYPILLKAIAFARAQLPADAAPGAVVSKAADYTQAGAADALTRLGVTNDHLENMLTARLADPVPPAPTVVVAAAKA